MSDQRSIELRLKANVSDFNAQIDTAARKADKFGAELEASSRKVEVARNRERDAAMQVAAAEKRLVAAVRDSKASASQLATAQKEVERAKNAHKAATDSLTSAERKHAQASQQAATAGGRLARSADENAAAWQTAGGILTAVGASITALGAAALKTGIDYNTLQQSSRAALRTLLGGTEAANEQMDKLDAFAKKSPFSKAVFITAQQQMLAFGIATEKVIPYLDALNDGVAAAGGSSQTLSELAYIMAQIGAAGKITAQDLMQFGQRGVNAAGLIGDAMNMTGAEVRQSITKGTLDAGTALDALAEGMKARYGGAAANVKETWLGATDRISAAWRDLSSELAEPLVGKNGGGGLVQLTNAGADLMRTFQKLPGPVKTTAAAIVGVVGASSLASGGLALLAPRLVQTKKDLATLAVQFPKVNRAMSVMGITAKVAGAALAVGTVALTAWAVASADADARTAGFASTLEVINGKAVRTDDTLRELNRQIVEQKTGWLSFIGVGSTLGQMTDEMGISFADLQGSILGAAGARDRLNAALQSWAASQGTDEASMTSAAAAVQRYNIEVDYLAGRLSDAEKQTALKALADQQAGVASAEAADGAEEHADALTNQATAAQQAEDRLKALLSAIWATSDATRASSDSVLEWHQAWDDANETLDKNAKAVEKNGKALSLNTQAGRDNRRALNEIQDAAKARISQMISEDASSSKIIATTQKLRDKYIDAAKKAGYLGDEAKKMADKAGLIPKDIKLQLAVDTGGEDPTKTLETLKSAIKGLPEETQTKILSEFEDGGVQDAYSALAKVSQKRARALIEAILNRTGITQWDNYRPATKYATIETRIVNRGGRNTQQARASGGSVFGPGTETSDSIPALLSNNEHVWSAREVRGAGGHAAMERLRAMARAGQMPAFRDGGAVTDPLVRLASGGSASAKAKAAAKEREKALRQLERDLRTQIRRGSIVDSVESGSGLSVIDDLIGWSRDSNLSGNARGKLRTKALAFEKRLGSLTGKLEKAESKLDELQQVFDTVKSGLNSFDLSAALEPTTKQTYDARTGQITTTTQKASAASIAKAANSRAHKVKVFAQKLAQLQKKGASPAVMSELAALGPDEGIPAVDEFLKDAKSLESLNRSYQIIDKYSSAAGQAVTESYSKGGLAAAEAMVKKLDKEMTSLGKQMADAFAAALGLKVSGKSLKKRATGGHVVAGELYQVNERGVEMFRPAMNGYVLNASQTAAGNTTIFQLNGVSKQLPDRMVRNLEEIAEFFEDAPNYARSAR